MPIHGGNEEPVPEPMKRKDLLEVLAGLQPLAEEDWFPDVDDTLLPSKDIDL